MHARYTTHGHTQKHFPFRINHEANIDLNWNLLRGEIPSMKKVLLKNFIMKEMYKDFHVVIQITRIESDSFKCTNIKEGNTPYFSVYLPFGACIEAHSTGV